MTRDVRIALLVGLTFIVLFGLVLGDRSVKLSRVAPAPPPTAAARRASPGPEVRSAAIERIDFTDAPPVLSPEPAPARRAAAGRVAANRAAPVPAGVSGATGGGRRPGAGRVLGPTLPRSSEHRAAGSPAPGASPPAAPSPPRRPRLRKYRVRPGDSLIRIARKVWGRQHADKYMLIYRANRSRLRNPQTLAVGQELVIPPLTGSADLALGSASARPAPSARPAGPARRHYREVTLGALSECLRGYRVYTVRPGDTLTGIARREMGDGSRRAVRALHQANRDRIGDPDNLTIGMKLRVPDWRGGGG